MRRSAARAACSSRSPQGSICPPATAPRIVGFTTAGRGRGGAIAEARLGEGEVETLYVLDDWRERGIGRRLLQAAAGHLAQAGCRSLYVWVLRDNPSRWFYQRLGGTPNRRGSNPGGRTVGGADRLRVGPDPTPAGRLAAEVVKPAHGPRSGSIGPGKQGRGFAPDPTKGRCPLEPRQGRALGTLHWECGEGKGAGGRGDGAPSGWPDGAPSPRPPAPSPPHTPSHEVQRLRLWWGSGGKAPWRGSGRSPDLACLARLAWGSGRGRQRGAMIGGKIAQGSSGGPVHSTPAELMPR